MENKLKWDKSIFVRLHHLMMIANILHHRFNNVMIHFSFINDITKYSITLPTEGLKENIVYS